MKLSKLISRARQCFIKNINLTVIYLRHGRANNSRRLDTVLVRLLDTHRYFAENRHRMVMSSVVGHEEYFTDRGIEGDIDGASSRTFELLNPTFHHHPIFDMRVA